MHTLHMHETEKLLGGSGAMLARKMLKSRVSEMPFPTFWRENLQNSEGYETPYKNTQIKYLTLFGVG